ncbi:MAG: response regulator, partial [Sphaerochaetaceae bacterium]|nr:response regulator [Sphaerochaetaceae bacterium]
MRLLLAEDEIELSKALSTVLMRNSYSVDAVFNGQEALDYLESPDYDALILDIMMPIKDGIEVLQTIRAKGNKIPVLILTAKSSIDDRVLGLDLGADDYLTKPFATEEL